MDQDRKLLQLLEENARYTAKELAVLLGADQKEVEARIAALEKEGIIRKYKTVVDWDRFDQAAVSALIEITAIPESDTGFEEIARQIMRYDEVETVYLMSGGYDLCVIVSGRTFKEVAMFVAKELAPMASVTSTATRFVLRRYKELKVDLCDSFSDDRERVSLC